MMMQKIELIYDRDCPNAGSARGQLIRALSRVDFPVQWLEWCRDDPDAPVYVRQYSSPTILVDGQDIDPNESGADACRLYTQSDGSVSGVPPLATIIAALKQDKNSGFDWRSSGAWMPAVGVAFLPKLVCPACWPAYAALVGTLGLSFLTQVQYLLPLTVMALLLLPGLRAGKFHYNETMLTYVGGSLLLIACIWHSWPQSSGTNRHCPYCVDTDQDV